MTNDMFEIWFNIFSAIGLLMGLGGLILEAKIIVTRCKIKQEMDKRNNRYEL